MGEAPESRIGPFTILREIGRGGMGVVYHGRDPSLGRDVAVKVLPPGAAPRVRERFLREGKLAGRLRHPGIVSVYAAGEDGEVAYLAQELIEGGTLADMLSLEPLTPGHAAALVEQVARALHYAHTEGVIHRDVKPANILMDRDGRPKVADFGLARDIQASAQFSRSGEVLGTPHYVSPEQGEGKVGAIDGRTDVWACGIVLYECLTGSLPFDSDTPVGVLAAVLQREAPPLRTRTAGLPRALEIIVAKCLEKPLERRYTSALELAEDLARFQRGDPIQARPPSLITRFRRRVAKRRFAAVALGAGLLALAAGIAIAVPALLASEAATLRRMSEVSRTSLDAAIALRRAGDLAGARTFGAKVETACDEAHRALPRSAEPHHLRGRLHRILLDDARALQAQSRAIALAPNHAAARYERVVLGARAYVARLDLLRARTLRRQAESASPAKRGETEALLQRAALTRSDPEASRLHAQLLADLQFLEQAPPTAIAPALAACAAGYRAWAEQDLDRARERLEAALAADPALSEASELLGRVLADRFSDTDAIAVLSAGLERDRGNVRLIAQRARANLEQAEDEYDDRDDPHPFLRAGLADCAAWLHLMPGSPEALSIRARLLRRLASQRRLEGTYDVPSYEAATADYDAILDADPKNADAWFLRGDCAMSWAFSANRFDQDPVPLYERALRDFGRVIALNPGDLEAWRKRARTHQLLGRFVLARGEDPAPHFTAAAADLEATLKVLPAADATHRRLGDLYRDLAKAAAAADGDPIPHLRAAVAAYTRAVELYPKSTTARSRRLSAREEWIDALVARNQDPTAQEEQAIAEMREAAGVHPESGRWPRLEGGVLISRGFRLRRTPDLAACHTAYAGALAALSRSLALDDADAMTWEQRGRARTNRSLDFEDPARRLAGIDAGVADYEAAIARDAKRAYSRYLLGRAHQAAANAVLALQGDPEPRWSAAADAFDAALVREPDHAASLEERTRVLQEWANRLLAAKRDPEALEVLRRLLTALEATVAAGGPGGTSAERGIANVRNVIRTVESR